MKYLWGYELDDVGINTPPIPDVKSGTQMRFKKSRDGQPIMDRTVDQRSRWRTPMSVMLPHAVKGLAPCIPNTSHTQSLACGWYYRVARGHDVPDKRTLRRIAGYTREFCRMHFRPLPPDADDSLETWLATTNYTEDRKATIRLQTERYINGEIKREKFLKVKGFCKEESYGNEFKHLRTINSRSDAFKGAVGPMTKLIETEIFKKDWFIKKIPGPMRAEYIMSKVWQPGGIYVCTDYTSFESSFTPEVMKNIEFVVYDYMTRLHPSGKRWMSTMRQLLARNRIQYRGFSASLRGTRMSGEMNTSLGNGLTNLILFSWACQEQGIDFRGVVEGDDGLFCVSQIPDFTYMRSAGFAVKPEVHHDIGEASFCGQVFDTVERQLVRDPIKSLVKYGWSSSVYKYARSSTLRQLARARAMSMHYENPSCPVLWKFSRKVLEFTDGVDVSRVVLNERDAYHRAGLIAACESEIGPPVPPGPRTRMLVEKKWGLLYETQLIIEGRIDVLSSEDNLELPQSLIACENNELMWWEYVSEIEPFFLKKDQMRPCKEDIIKRFANSYVP